MSLEQIIENLSKEVGIKAIPQLDKKGSYQLHINKDTQISITETDQGIFFFVRIIPIPEMKSQEVVFIYLMKANLLGQGTGGSVIGIDTLEKHFTLSLSLTENLSYKIFKDYLEEFLNYLDFWKEEIPSYIAKVSD